jgi:hypothetical protein
MRLSMTATPGLLGAVSTGHPTAPVDHEIPLSLERARAFSALRSIGTRCEFSESLNDRHSSSQLFGVPDFARLGIVGDDTPRLPQDPADTLIISAARVFRQYVRTEEDVHAILRDSVLIPGTRCFYEIGGPNGVPFMDLVGIFATTPDFRPDEVGVPDSKFYVDFAFPAGAGLLHLSRKDDRYWMLPGIPQRPAWFREYYQAWTARERPDAKTSMQMLRDSGYQDRAWKFASHVAEFVEIDAHGGLPEPSRLPVQIVGHGRI